MNRILLIICAILCASPAFSQNFVGPLELDSTYPPTTHTGFVTLDVSGAQKPDSATCYVAYFDKSIRQASPFYVAGLANKDEHGGSFGITKYNADLTPDLTFGTNGIAVPFSVGYQYPTDMMLLPNGSICAVGVSDATKINIPHPAFYCVAPDGSPDDRFAGGVRPIMSTTGIFTAIDTMAPSAGSSPADIIGMGYVGFDAAPGFVASRVDRAGTLDLSFGQSGVATIPASISKARGHLYLADSVTREQHIQFVGMSTDNPPELLLAQMKQNGVIDSQFGTNGIVHTGLKLEGGSWFSSKASHIAHFDTLGKIQFYDNELLVAAPLMPKSANLPISLIRFKANGNIDSSFALIDNANGIVTSASLADMDSGATLSFSNDGSLLLCGSQHGYGVVAKFFSVGHIDSTFGDHGVAVLNKGFGNANYRLIGFPGLGGNVGNKQFGGVGTSFGGATQSDFLITRYMPIPIMKLSTTILSYGLVDTGSYRDLNFTITNYDTILRTIDTVTTTGLGFSIEPIVRQVPIAPGGSYTITARYAPIGFDTTHGSVAIMEHSALGQPLLHNVALEGRGAAPKAGVSITKDEDIVISPNPASLNINILGADVLSFTLLDAIGRTISAPQTSLGVIDVSALAEGMYLLDLRTRQGHTIRKISVRR